VWKFLRKTSLDELPNLFSVITGTMSLVWPRPHLPCEIEKYKDWQKRLLSIKPGITGYAQIFGRDNLSFDDEARLDLYYIQHRSLLMDLYIILRTFGVIFKWK
jgi:lipopolysaccharide/colanic/teichoic acid biosynthesis glycosyltransferase